MLIKAPKIKKGFLPKVEEIVGPNSYSIKNLDRLNYSRDSSFINTIQIKFSKVEYYPDVIVWPETVEQVQKLVRLCSKHKVPVVPYGAGSGVCGGTVPVEGGMIIDIKKMNHLLKVDGQNLTAVAEAGIMSLHLEEELQRQGYTLGHFPSSIICASLGGCLAARSAGQLSSRYGKIEDMALDLEVVTGRGDILQTRYVNNNEGIDLNQVFLGSEGTLGLITKATLRIYPLPENVIFQAVRLKDIYTGIETIRRFIQTGVKPSVVRLYDELDTLLLLSSKTSGESIQEPGIIDRVQEFIKFRSLRKALVLPRALNAATKLIPTGCALVLMFEGHESVIKEEKKILLGISRDMGGEDLGEDPARHWYENRYRVSYNASPIFDAGNFTDTIEVAASWDKLGKLYDEIVQVISPHAMIMAHLSHVYTDGGSLYFTFVAPLKGLKAGEKLYDFIWDRALKTCHRYGGVISHHHGIGRLKAKYIVDEWGDGLKLYQSIKNYYDPYHIMNPGKMVIEKGKEKVS